jgi:putative peptidoglycan lipid II flippase
LKKKGNIRSIGTLSIITTGNVLISFMNTILLAYYFGVSRELEIYLAGVTLFRVMQKLSQSGFLGEVYIPYLVKLSGTKHYQDFVNSIINILLLFCIFLFVMLFLFSKPLMQMLIPGFSSADTSLAIRFFRIILPLLILTIMNSFFVAILQARREFNIPEIGSFLGQLTGILLFILLVSNMGIKALLISFMITPIIRFIFCSFYLKDHFYKYRLVIKWKNKLIKESILKITPFIGYTIMTQGVQFVMISIVSFLPQGSLAILKYAQNMFNKISLITTGPIVTVSFVEFSESIKNSINQYLSSFKKFLFSTISLSLLIAALFIISGQELITLLFVRGKFTTNDASIIYLGIVVQTLSWPFLIYWVLAKKSFLVIHKTNLVTILLTFHQFIHILLIYAFSRIWGVIGVLVATSSTSFIFVFVYYYFQRKYFSFKMYRVDFIRLFKILFIIMGGVIPAVVIKQYLIDLSVIGDTPIIFQQFAIITLTLLVYCLFIIPFYKLIRVKELDYSISIIQTFILNKIKKNGHSRK